MEFDEELVKNSSVFNDGGAFNSASVEPEDQILSEPNEILISFSLYFRRFYIFFVGNSRLDFHFYRLLTNIDDGFFGFFVLMIVMSLTFRIFVRSSNVYGGCFDQFFVQRLRSGLLCGLMI
uniref:Transmembrane protein n=1 Tax=Romanomermis culicivorax TaxID=13658 RepID=A0A915KZ69_ROMCU